GAKLAVRPGLGVAEHHPDVAVGRRRQRGDLSGRLAEYPRSALRGGVGRWRKPRTEVRPDHASHADTDDLFPACAGHDRCVPDVYSGLHRRRADGRTAAIGPVLYAVYL